MKVLGIHHAQIAIPPGTEETARAFYCGLLGLPELPKPEPLASRGGFWVVAGPQQIHFGMETPSESRPSRRHVALLVDDIQGARRRLVDAGVAVRDGIPIPGYDRFELRDPFGNRLELLALAQGTGDRTAEATGSDAEGNG
ncbi:MAG: VOC family protein [Acidobacteriota bacterium]